MKTGVAGLAVGNGFDIFDNFMLDFQMALVAFNFVRGDVDRVHQVGLGVAVEAIPLKMAFVTVLARHSAVANDDLAVAAVT